MIKDLWEGPRYTEDELMARLKFFIGMVLALTLFGIVFVVLYSLIFVTQPMNGMSPVDNKFFELIIPIATFLTGTLSGIMLASGDKEAQKQALAAANKGWDKPPSPPQPTVTIGSSGITVSQMPQQSGNQTVTLGFGGKPVPPQPPFPEL
jgi:Na+-transporting methylmalonyl-CoA/oxaloacetate decarboxylase gamma subunit